MEFAIGIVAVLAVAVANHLPEDCAREKLLGKLGGAVAVSLAHGVAGNSGVPSFSSVCVTPK